MSKFIVKTKLSNIKKEKGQFTYREEIVSMKWDEKAKRNAVQSGKGPGEFGPDYSDRKQYHLKRSPYPAHVIEPYTKEKKMACDNIDCNCEGCTCDPCICTPDSPCGCDVVNHSNEWKGVI